MTLVCCNECGNQISDKAQHCVHCGFNIETSTAVVGGNFAGDPEEVRIVKSVGRSREENSSTTLPVTISLFKYITFIVALLHIAFTFFGPLMYPLKIIILLYSNGIFISQNIISILLSIFLIFISLKTVKTKNTILRIMNGIIYVALCVGSFQVFYDLKAFGMVWQWRLEGPRIAQAPFAFMMVALQLSCVVLLFVPQSSRYFSQKTKNQNP